MLRKVPLVLTLALATVSTVTSASAQAVPEFFGFYAVDQGKNIAIHEGQGTGSTIALDAYSIPRQSRFTAQVPQLSATTRFILYYSDAGDMVHSLSLYRLPVLRNVIETVPATAFSPPTRQIVESPNTTLVAGVAELAYKFLVKPVSGHPQMVELLADPQMTPGYYVVKYAPASGSSWWALFAVGSPPTSASESCVDLVVPGGVGGAFWRANSELIADVPSLVQEHYQKCNSGGSSGIATRTATVSASAAQVTCANYDECFKLGLSAFQSKDLNTAEADFRAAAQFSPGNPEAWRWVGTVMLGNNEIHQVGDLAATWDKALSLGGPLVISACHERTMQPCERGDLLLSPKMITFQLRGMQHVFSAAPSEIEPGKVLNNPGAQHVAYNLKAGGKNYVLDFIPSSWQSCNFNMMVQCQPDGTAEQLILASYVAQTLPKLASGQVAASVAPATPAPAAATKAVSGLAGCAALPSAGYSILLQSHLFRVVTGSTKQLYFLNESGSQVTDASLLSQLASVVWTHDNILPDARYASGHVSDILSTSKAIQHYTASQDLIARAMVEAMEGAATDGASLAKVPVNLTIGFVKSQITNAPRNILTDTAQAGLNQSLNLYKQMESVPLPPADATVLNASDMSKILTLYTQAHTLDLPYSALAAKLMPQHTQDLTDAALKSIISELTAGPVFAGSPTAAMTTSQLLLLQTSLANLANGNVALQAFHDNLNLAVNLNKANSAAIDRIASGASTQQCKP